MNKLALVACSVLALGLAGCADKGLTPVTQDDLDDRSRITAAQGAIAIGKYQLAESLLATYVGRNEKNELVMRSNFGLQSKSRKMVIDAIAALLWETGRDESNLQFADDYLSGDERTTVFCRVAERQAKYKEAFTCWNSMGHGDRAARVLRTQGAMEILAKP